MADLVDAIEPAGHQPLEVQLVRDAQVEILVVAVVMGRERPRGGAPVQGLERGRLDLEEAATVEAGAQRRDDPAAQQRGAARRLVHEQVEMALPESGLDVGQPVPLLGQRAQALREQLGLPGVDGELAGARAPDGPFDAHEVPHVEVAQEREPLRRELLLLRAHLDRRAVLDQREEEQVAEGAQRADAPHHGDGSRTRFQRRGVQRVEAKAHLGDGRARPDARGIGFDPRAPQRFQPIAPRLPLAFAHEATGTAPARASSVARMKASRSPESTASTLPDSCSVRWSFTRCCGCRV